MFIASFSSFAEMTERRVEVVARLKSLEEMATPMIRFLQNPSLVQDLRSDKQHMIGTRYFCLHIAQDLKINSAVIFNLPLLFSDIN